MRDKTLKKIVPTIFCGGCPWCGKYVSSSYTKNNMPVIDFPMDYKVAEILDRTDTQVITGDPFCPFCHRHLYKKAEVEYFSMEQFIEHQRWKPQWKDELKEYIKNNPQIREEHKKKHLDWMRK